MPNRIIREGIITSDRVNSLNWPAEVFYRRLLNIVDDYGRFDGRADILRAQLYALKLDRVSSGDVSSWIAECEKAGLVTAYEVDGKPFLQIVNFGQKVRAKSSKWPDPPTSDNTCAHLRADARLGPSTSTPSDAPSDGRHRLHELGRIGFRLPDNINRADVLDAIESWLEEREHRREPSLSIAGANEMAARLSRFGPDRAVAAIKYSISQQFKGIYEESSNGRTDDNRPGRIRSSDRKYEAVGEDL